MRADRWFEPRVDFFPFEIDLRSLAAFRICFALVLLVDLAIRASDLGFFYTDDGVLPRADAYRLLNRWAVSLHLLSGSWEAQAGLFLAAAVAHLMLLAGYRTQPAAVLSWVLVVSLHRRNEALLQGGDDLIRCLAFWSMFLPLGSRWSIDRRLHRSDDAEVASSLRSIPGCCILLQIATLYLFSVAMKTGEAWRVSYSAVFAALSVEQLSTELGRQLLHYPGLLRLLTAGVLLLEQLGPLLALSPFYPRACRMAAVVLFMWFHFGLLLTMELGPFPYVCLAAWTLFLPPPFWSAVARSRSALPSAGALRREPVFCERRIVRDFALSLFLLNVMAWNFSMIPGQQLLRYPVELAAALKLVGLDQSWGMFSPYPFNWDGWYEIRGVTRSGRTVNLLPAVAPDRPIPQGRPSPLGAFYPNERWRKYLMLLATPEGAHLRPLYARALVAEWRTKHPEDPLRAIEISYWQELTELRATSPAQKLLLWQQVIE